jgi:hypothetical protein
LGKFAGAVVLNRLSHQFLDAKIGHRRTILLQSARLCGYHG